MESSRPIRFRAWDIFNGEMFYSDQWVNSGGSLAEFFMQIDKLIAGENSVVLMQFTGLHDKNAKKIFEGDILFWQDINTQFTARIEWWEDRWVARNKEQQLRVSLMVVPQGREVIGNRFEHPELLK